MGTDPNRTRDTWLSGDEPASLERLHHLVDGRRRNQEVPLDVRLGGSPAKAMDVLLDEGKVLELPLGGLLLGIETV